MLNNELEVQHVSFTFNSVTYKGFLVSKGFIGGNFMYTVNVQGEIYKMPSIDF